MRLGVGSTNCLIFTFCRFKSSREPNYFNQLKQANSKSGFLLEGLTACDRCWQDQIITELDMWLSRLTAGLKLPGLWRVTLPAERNSLVETVWSQQDWETWSHGAAPGQWQRLPGERIWGAEKDFGGCMWPWQVYAPGSADISRVRGRRVCDTRTSYSLSVAVFLEMQMGTWCQSLGGNIVFFRYKLKSKSFWGWWLTFVAHVSPACDVAVGIGLQGLVWAG